MKITVEFDPGELAKGAGLTAPTVEQQVSAAAPTAPPGVDVAMAAAGAIDGGPAPGAVTAAPDYAMAGVPTELASQAASTSHGVGYYYPRGEKSSLWKVGRQSNRTKTRKTRTAVCPGWNT